MTTYTTQVQRDGTILVEREEKHPSLWYGMARFDAQGDCRENTAVFFSTREQMVDLYNLLGAMLQDAEVTDQERAFMQRYDDAVTHEWASEGGE